MTTNNTTNINTEPTITLSPRVLAFFISSIGAYHANRYSEHLRSNLEIGRKYTYKSESNLGLRYMYSASLVLAGVINIEVELIDAVPDIEVAKVMEKMRIYYTGTGRLLQYDRTNMLGEFARGVMGQARDFQISRSRRFTLKENKKSRSRSDYENLSDINAHDGPPRNNILDLAQSVTACWQCAAQSIVSHLPPAERQEAADEAERAITYVTDILGKLYTLAKNSSVERKRWELGYGAVDRAVYECVGLITLAMKWVDRMDPNNSFSDAMRRPAIEDLERVKKALEKLADDRMEILSYNCFSFDQHNLVRYGRATGGMAPALEVLFHARGSTFTGY